MQLIQVTPGLDGAELPAVCTITLNDELNRLTPTLVGELGAALAGVAKNKEIQVVVLLSHGRAFCAGFNLPSEPLVDEGGPDLLVGQLMRIQELLESIQSLPCLTVAFVDGPAVGAGADLVAACDVRLGSDKARFRFPGPRFGLVLGTSRLVSLVGGDAALTMLTDPQWVTTEFAVATGLLTAQCSRSDLESRVVDWQQRVSLLHPSVRGILLATVRGRPQQSPTEEFVRSVLRVGFASDLTSYAQQRGASS